MEVYLYRNRVRIKVYFKKVLNNWLERKIKHRRIVEEKLELKRRILKNLIRVIKMNHKIKRVNITKVNRTQALKDLKDCKMIVSKRLEV